MTLAEPPMNHWSAPPTLQTVSAVLEPEIDSKATSEPGLPLTKVGEDDPRSTTFFWPCSVMVLPDTKPVDNPFVGSEMLSVPPPNADGQTTAR